MSFCKNLFCYQVRCGFCKTIAHELKIPAEKLLKHFLHVFLICVAIIVSTAVQNVSAQNSTKTLTIIHTNDLQSRLLGFGPNREYTPLTLNDDQTLGGIARVATVIKLLKQKSPETTLVIDGGDVLMGTLFHTLAREESPELRLLNAIGYDAIALGNHEFDFRPLGLAQIINAALAKGSIPALLCANAVFNAVDARDDSLQALFARGVVRPYQIIVKNGLRIGVFGVLGMAAAEVGPFAAPVTFADPIATAKRVVKTLKENENVDVIICASHGGVRWNAQENKWEGEDVALAAEVPEIDVVVGGHSHTFLSQPIIVNNTPVVQAGSEGRYVGALNLQIANGAVTMQNYRTVAINDSIPADRDIQALVEPYQDIITQKILRPYGFTFNQILTETDFALKLQEDNSNLGDLVSDAIRWRIDQLEYHPAAPETRTVIAVASNGLIRDDIIPGLQQVSDLFRVVPLGIGELDEAPGFGLVSFYLTAQEIKKAFEVVTTVYPRKGNDFFLQVSGAKFRYNPNRLLFDRVMDIEIADSAGVFLPLDLSSSNQRLYKIGSNFFVGAFIKVIGDFTSGILTIIPKDQTGKPIAELTQTLVDVNPAIAGIQEAKEWTAFLEYVKKFPDTNGNHIPDMPEGYRLPQGRIGKIPSWNPTLFFRNATYLTWGASGIICILVLGAGWLARFLVSKASRALKQNSRQHAKIL